MGFGIPAAIGAAIARPEGRVVAVCGDGGAQMTAEELIVAAELRLPVVFVVISNGCLGMVRQMQEMFFGGNTFGVALRSPDFCKLAAAHGLKAWRVTDPARLETALRRALRAKEPVLVDVAVDPAANV